MNRQEYPVNIKIDIYPENVKTYYEAEKSRLIDDMHIIACSQFDDADKKCYLFVTDDNDEMFVSLEAPNGIIDSWINPSVEEIKFAIIRLSELTAEYFDERNDET